MAEIPVEPDSNGGPLNTAVGVSVVLLATFMALCNVKASNIAQQMQQKQVDRNDHWAFYQARNIREAVYEATAEELALPRTGESAADRAAREAKAADFRKRSADQAVKKQKPEADAREAEEKYEELSAKDDQFDLCEASLALALAMLGVTALLKRWWLFAAAMVPGVFGVATGVLGFAGTNINSPIMKQLTGWLS